MGFFFSFLFGKPLFWSKFFFVVLQKGQMLNNVNVTDAIIDYDTSASWDGRCPVRAGISPEKRSAVQTQISKKGKGDEFLCVSRNIKPSEKYIKAALLSLPFSLMWAMIESLFSWRGFLADGGRRDDLIYENLFLLEFPRVQAVDIHR